MPYLPIDLDGRKACEKAACVLGVHPGLISWALQEAWEHCWRQHFGQQKPDADVLSELYLTACLGPLAANPKTIETLIGFGFLEPVEGGWRVRGAKKWLFGLEGRKRGGLASRGNLLPGGKRSAQPTVSRDPESTPLGIAETPAETPAEREPRPQPRPSRSADPRLLHPASSIQHPTASLLAGPAAQAPATDSPKPKKETKPADPRFAEMVERIHADFLEVMGVAYGFQGAKDGSALRALLRLGTNDEISVRFRRGLVGQGWLRAVTVAQLLTKWNDLATGPPKKPIDVTRGMVRAQDVNKASYATPGVVVDF